MNSLSLTIQAIKSCKYQGDLSIDSIAKYKNTFYYLMIVDINEVALKHAGYRISDKNKYGWRQTPVTINNASLLPAQFIERQIELLVNNQNNLTPEEFFIKFEKIHPYNDGNGRVGEILYYKLTGSFDVPEFN